MLYNFQFESISMLASNLASIFRFLVSYTKNVQYVKKTCHALLVSNITLQAMIFHEDKVKLSVTLEKFPNGNLITNELGTF